MKSDFRTKPKQTSRDRKAPDYFARPVKMRLATLVAVLGLVMVAMHEAGKPETWERMGFGSAEATPTHRTRQTGADSTPELSFPVESNALDEPTYALIEDRTSINRSVEAPAWTRSWARLQAGPAIDSIAPVSYVQLVGQPDAWRGKWVVVEGTVRGLERTKANNREIGFQDYHVLWVKPRDSNRSPYCVYVRTLPAGFPSADGRYADANEPVSVTGIFFKLRSYEAANEQIETCPLILADTISWKPVAATPTVAPWNPPIWLLILFFIGMPVVAAWLAVAAWRSTKISRLAGGQHSRDEIRETLSSMKDNADIKSDLEKVRQLSGFDND